MAMCFSFIGYHIVCVCVRAWINTIQTMKIMFALWHCLYIDRLQIKLLNIIQYYIRHLRMDRVSCDNGIHI